MLMKSFIIDIEFVVICLVFTKELNTGWGLENTASLQDNFFMFQKWMNLSAEIRAVLPSQCSVDHKCSLISKLISLEVLPQKVEILII